MPPVLDAELQNPALNERERRAAFFKVCARARRETLDPVFQACKRGAARGR